MAWLLAGCSAAGVGAGTMAPRGDGVGREAIRASGVRDAWEALRLLRPRVSLGPHGLRSRGSAREPLVVVDGVRVHDARSALAAIPADALESLRFLASGEAGGLFGTDAGAGVLVVETRGG